MARERGRRRRSSGLPRSAIPFAGPGRPEANGSGSEEAAQAERTARPEALELLSELWISRAADERLAGMHEEGLLPLAPLRPPLREAGVVAAARAIRARADGTGDVLAPTRRAAGALLRLGTDLETWFGEQLAGRIGSVHGSVTELHRVDFRHGLFAPVAPLGVAVEVMAGITLAFRLRGEDRAGVVFDSDGASSTGNWHEGLVVAAARRCPLVVVVERTSDDPVHRRGGDGPFRSLDARGAGYGTPVASVDGADAPAVVRVLREAVEAARVEGVHLVEIRYGLDEGEPDPIVRLRDRLLEGAKASVDELDALEGEARARVDEAAERALARAEQPVEEAPGAVYAGGEAAVRATWAAGRESRLTRG